MKARIYKTTVDLEVSQKIRITEKRYLCIETSEGKVHIMNYEYKDFNTLADIKSGEYAYWRDDLWEHLGLCDGICEETYDFPEGDYEAILEMEKENEEFIMGGRTMETYCDECGNPSDSCDCSVYWLEQERRERVKKREEEMLTFVFGKICADRIAQKE